MGHHGQDAAHFAVKMTKTKTREGTPERGKEDCQIAIDTMAAAAAALKIADSCVSHGELAKVTGGSALCAEHKPGCAVVLVLLPMDMDHDLTTYQFVACGHRYQSPAQVTVTSCVL